MHIYLQLKSTEGEVSSKAKKHKQRAQREQSILRCFHHLIRDESHFAAFSSLQSNAKQMLITKKRLGGEVLFPLPFPNAGSKKAETGIQHLRRGMLILVSFLDFFCSLVAVLVSECCGM